MENNEAKSEPRSGSLHVMVGVADAESEVCPDCNGEGGEETMTDCGPECAWVCETCDGMGSVRRNTPTDKGQESPNKTN